MFFVKLKSGLGSCIAPKAGLARHPAKGMFLAGMLYTFGFEGASDQGVVGGGGGVMVLFGFGCLDSRLLCLAVE